MSLELKDTLSICRQIRGNNHDSGTHYLLGYLWANTSDKEKKRIYKLFKKDLDEIQEKIKDQKSRACRISGVSDSPPEVGRVAPISVGGYPQA